MPARLARTALGAVACVVLLPAAARAQQSTAAPAPTAGVRVMHAARRSGPIVIDGRLDELAWQQAPVASHFTQSYPDPGKPPTDRTEVRILYDDDALYVGVRMYDAHPDSIAAQLARRDASGIYSDWLHVIIDSYHDRRTAFRFSVNPRGVEKDVFESDDAAEDLNWDAVWQVATRVDSLGWTAEYRIPLSQLRFGRQRSDSTRVWGIQVMRDVARRNERDSWSPWTPQTAGFVSAFGDLVGLRDIPTPRRLEIVPYVSSKLTRAAGDPADPFYRHNDAQPSAGADIRSGLPGGLTLTAALNPDFGQVEVDPAVVNLSAYETFFPEKRPFFLEGADIFGFGQPRRYNDFGSQYFFYSRRIGRAPELSPYGPNVLFADVPTQTTIAGAAKVTGRAGPWSVGILDALTTRADARVATTAGAQDRVPVEPLTDYFAARVKHDFRQGASFVGGMLTTTARDLSDSSFLSTLHRDATLGGIDFEHGMHNRGWVLSGYLAGSRVAGTPQAIALTQRSSTHYLQRPDASYLTYDPSRTSLSGYSDELALEKASGAVYGSVAYKEMNPGFELNDLGYVGRGDYRALSTLVGYQDYTAGRHLRTFGASAFSANAWNFGGTGISRTLGGSAFGTFNDFWSVNGGLNRTLSAYDDRLLRGGPLAWAAPGWYAYGSVTSDSRKPVVVGLNGSFQRDAAGGQDRSLGVSFDMRPTSALHITVTPTLDRLQNTAQYVQAVTDPAAAATYGTRYVFADLRQTTLSMEGRIDWTLSTRLSLQSYVQPFVAAGSYSDFKEFLTPGTRSFGVYGRGRGTIAHDPAAGSYTVDPDGSGPAPAFTFGDPDFNVRSLRGNAVLRWEYRPGSAIYLVWQQLRSGYAPLGDFDTRRDVGAIFRNAPTNVLLLKATYWLGR